MSKLLSDEKIETIANEVGAPTSRYFPYWRTTVDLCRAIEAAVLDARPTDQRLLNLLCRIHRDGGHYIAEHGLDKAVGDADIRVAERNAALDAQAKQEPVAWMHWYKYYDGTDVVKVAIGHAPTFNDQSPFRSEPLFAAPVVQPDMVMVPRKLTRAMNEAAWFAVAGGDITSTEELQGAFDAMIAAAEGKK